MKEELNEAQLEKLYNVLASLSTAEECKKFLKDLCTSNELRAMAQRLSVAILLKNKKVYTQIIKETGASNTTIYRVNRCLSEGEGGYKMALEHIGE